MNLLRIVDRSSFKYTRMSDARVYDVRRREITKFICSPTAKDDRSEVKRAV